jgi:hypothetical protein
MDLRLQSAPGMRKGPSRAVCALAICSIVALGGCRGGDHAGDDDSVDADVDRDGRDGCPAEEPSVPEWQCDRGDVCAYPTQGGATDVCACSSSWSTICTSCPWDDDRQDLDLSSCTATDEACTISDVEHDFDCDCVAPEMEWRCCSYFASAGVVCQGEACGSEAGTPCCEGQVHPDDPSLTCAAGRWQPAG